MFKLIKFSATMFVGMLIAPKRGFELRTDLANYLKKYRPQLKKFINIVEDAWAKSQDQKMDEITANIEYKVDDLKNKALYLSENKDVDPYSILKGTLNISKKIGKEISKSENAQKIAQELAKVAVNVVDAIGKASSKANELSKSIAVKTIADEKAHNINKNEEIEDND